MVHGNTPLQVDRILFTLYHSYYFPLLTKQSIVKDLVIISIIPTPLIKQEIISE